MPRANGGCHVYRLDPATGACAIVADDFARPNGLAFSLDEAQLYIADSRVKHIRVFDVKRRRGSPAGPYSPRVRTDRSTGSAWITRGGCGPPPATACSATTPTELIGRLRLPETAWNLVFGGRKRNWLFISATTSVYSIMLSVNGAPPVWPR